MHQNPLLSEKEFIVFSALKSLGRSLVSEIAKETLFNRTALYHTLSILVEKGLVSELKIERVSYFDALSLAEYKQWRIRKDKQLYTAFSEIKSVVTTKAKAGHTLRSKIKYYEGSEAVKRLYAETWRNNPQKNILAITDYKAAYESLGNFFDREYFPDRVRHGVKVLSLLPKDEYGVRDLVREKELLREMRFTNIFKRLGIELNIFGGSVALFSFDKKGPTGILIENELIAEAFAKMFMFIWERSK